MSKLLNKKTIWTLIALMVAVVIAAKLFNPASMVRSQQLRNDAIIAEQMAESIGTLAYLYGYPIVDMFKQAHNETHMVDARQQTYAPVNRFYRFPEIVGPDNAGNIRLPNNDTLYFSAWFDISKEPLVIHTPDTDGRYFTIAVTNLYAEVSHIGRRTHGTEEAYYALVSPNWQGKLPNNITAIPVESERGWLLGRMLVDGPSDLDAAVSMMNDIWAVELSAFRPGDRPKIPEPQVADAIDPMDSLEFFQIMNQSLKRLPAREQEAALMAQFDSIGIGPNSTFNFDELDKSTRRGLEKALHAGRRIVEASEARTIPDSNGWMIPQKAGRYGFDYLQRASVVANGYANLPEESTYGATLTDSEGNMLSGAEQYKLHFPVGQLPPVNGFWSITPYAIPAKLVEENPIGRYSIGDRTSGIRYNDDGSLTLWLQNTPPNDKDKNWLPIPAGYFMAVVRMYEPQSAILEKHYALPRIEKAR